MLPSIGIRQDSLVTLQTAPLSVVEPRCPLSEKCPALRSFFCARRWSLIAAPPIYLACCLRLLRNSTKPISRRTQTSTTSSKLHLYTNCNIEGVGMGCVFGCDQRPAPKERKRPLYRAFSGWRAPRSGAVCSRNTHRVPAPLEVTISFA